MATIWHQENHGSEIIYYQTNERGVIDHVDVIKSHFHAELMVSVSFGNQLSTFFFPVDCIVRMLEEAQVDTLQSLKGKKIRRWDPLGRLWTPPAPIDIGFTFDVESNHSLEKKHTEPATV